MNLLLVTLPLVIKVELSTLSLEGNANVCEMYVSGLCAVCHAKN